MKRKVECPICRKDIKSKTPSLVLDNCINKMVDNLSSEVKERRTELIKRRKGEWLCTRRVSSMKDLQLVGEEKLMKMWKKGTSKGVKDNV